MRLAWGAGARSGAVHGPLEESWDTVTSCSRDGIAGIRESVARWRHSSVARSSTLVMPTAHKTRRMYRQSLMPRAQCRVGANPKSHTGAPFTSWGARTAPRPRYDPRQGLILRDRGGIPTTGRRGLRPPSRQARSPLPRSWALTLIVAAGLGLLVAVTTTSLPYLVSSPTADPHFGALNHCLTAALKGPRLGWAVAPDASRAATFGAHAVALCRAEGPPTVFPAPGASAITFDGDGRLWVATRERLLREEAGQLVPVGDLAPQALAGHASGVIALDAEGQLLSISPQGEVLGQATLPAPGKLSVGPGGTLAAVVLEGGVVAFEARTLTPLRAESPCRVEELWWLDAPERVLLACGPGQALALTLDLRTGQREEAPRRFREPARRLPSRTLYVHGCEGLPCTAPAP
jgi:hypothetical protein